MSSENDPEIFVRQRPKASVQSDNDIWYCCAPQDEKCIGQLLPNISVKYGLCQRYTNHSTSLQLLSRSNLWEIMAEGYHRPESVEFRPFLRVI